MLRITVDDSGIDQLMRALDDAIAESAAAREVASVLLETDDADDDLMPGETATATPNLDTALKHLQP